MAAAMAMAGTSNRPPPASTADRKREEERVADARRRAIAGDASESDSDVDDDELDDIDLVARDPARLRDGDANRRGRSEGSGKGAVGPALDLRGVMRANGGDGSSPPAAPRGIGAVVGLVGQAQGQSAWIPLACLPAAAALALCAFRGARGRRSRRRARNAGASSSDAYQQKPFGLSSGNDGFS